MAHYILKKTQLENCFFKECRFNQSFEEYINDGSIDDPRIIKRAVLEYHPFYSLVFTGIDYFINNNYLSFYFISHLASLLFIYFLFKIFSIKYKDLISFQNITIGFLIFIFTFNLLYEWRDAAKLNFGLFMYLLIPLIKQKEIKNKYYFLNILQIFIHPFGIISSFIILLFYYFKSHKYQINEFINFKINLKKKIITIFSLFVLVIYYLSGIKYVDSSLSIHSALLLDNFASIVSINKNNLISYYISTPNFIFLILFFITFFVKKSTNNKIFIYIFIIINLIHLINPSPEKSLIELFDFYIKFLSILFSLEIYRNLNKKLLKFAIIVPIIVFQIFFQAKNAYIFLKVRPVIDSAFYSKPSLEVINFINKKKNRIIYLVGSQDLLLYNQLNNGLINNKIFFNGLSHNKFKKYFQKNPEILIIFDLFNNPHSAFFNDKEIYTNKIRIFSNLFYNGDILKLKNNSKEKIEINLFSKHSSQISINNNFFDIKNNENFKIDVEPYTSINIKMKKIDGYLKLVSIKNPESSYNYPWKKNIVMNVKNNFLKRERLIDFSEKLVFFDFCRIKDILQDDSQIIYALGTCKVE